MIRTLAALAATIAATAGAAEGLESCADRDKQTHAIIGCAVSAVTWHVGERIDPTMPRPVRALVCIAATAVVAGGIELLPGNCRDGMDVAATVAGGCATVAILWGADVAIGGAISHDETITLHISKSW